MEAIHTVKYRDYYIKIYPDDSPINPREWDNIGTIFYAHRNYNLGEYDLTKLGDFGSWREIETYLIKNYNPVVILPLYLLDHSGTTISTSDFNDNWDSGKAGYIIAEREKVLKEYGKKRISKKLKHKVENILKEEVKMFDDCMRGNVYGFEIYEPIEKHEDPEALELGNGLDAVWGFIGDYDSPFLLDEAKSSIDYHIKTTQATKQNKLKTLIKNKVPLLKRSELLTI